MARFSSRLKCGIAVLGIGVAATAVFAFNADRDGLGRYSGSSGMPVTRLDISVLEPSGKSVNIEALTDNIGKLQIGYVPSDKWNAQSAVNGNRLVLPDDAFGIVSERVPEGALRDVSVLRDARALPDVFAVRNGQLIDPSSYALKLIEPFSLLCRSDEGPPARLAEGERYSYEVPEANLKQVLGQSFVLDPSFYKLPDNLGYSVSSAAGSSPKDTWAGLERLSRMDRISRLEVDPCWKFLPEAGPGAACEPGVREFPDKAVRLSNMFGGTLRNPYGSGGIGDAYVLYNPLSPTPYYDPGFREGDDRAPTFVRSGMDGGYRAMLNGLSGPIEIGVAKGCDEHTTVAIAEGPGTKVPTVGGLTTEVRAPQSSVATTVRGPMSVPPPKPVATAPPQKPAPDAKICGPDVTDHLMGTLKLIEDTYNKSWDAAERSRRCAVLYHPIKFNDAWDLQLFTPSEGDLEKPDPVYFERAAPGYCAVPRYPCGKTVQFMGQCIDAQVVNYLQWGVMNQLCGSQVRGVAAVLVRSFGNPNKVGQLTMGALGTAFLTIKDRTMAREVMQRLLNLHIRDNESDWYKMGGTDCALHCDAITPQARKWLDNASWGFQWDGETEPVTKRGFEITKP